MFTRLTLRGVGGSILWGYHCAIALKSWVITKEPVPPKPGQPSGSPTVQWKLTGTPVRVEPFMARQKPLLFTAPRAKGPAWAWGVDAIVSIGPSSVVARLGPPEQ